MRRRRAAPAIASLAATMMMLLASRPARAANEAHVRTPVLWPSDCGVVVDRSVDPVVHFDYAIPIEDTELTIDELPDSRTHQFIALCRERPLTELLPMWVTRDDVERSAAAGLLDPAELGSAAILDESPTWTDCFVRVTADDDRRPITFAQAALGFDWDTSEASVGVWQLTGHTFEPPLNLWRDRPGFVKIIDDPSDPEQDLPAIALLGDERVLEPGEITELDACVDLLGPGTISLEWAEFAPELDWQPLTTRAVEADGPLRIEFRAPSEAADRELLVRARLVDARGRERYAHLPARLTIAPCPAEGCVDPVDPVDPDDPDDPVDPEPPVDGGCACVSPNPPESAGLLLFPLVLLLRRRVAT